MISIYAPHFQSYRHHFCVAIFCIKHILLCKAQEGFVRQQTLDKTVYVCIDAYHVVCILSGVGEKLFIFILYLPVLLLFLELL